MKGFIMYVSRVGHCWVWVVMASVAALAPEHAASASLADVIATDPAKTAPTPAPARPYEQVLFSSRSDMFAAAGKTPSWWGQWGRNTGPGTQDYWSRIFAKGATVRHILDKDYGVRVPFDLAARGIPLQKQACQYAWVDKPLDGRGGISVPAMCPAIAQHLLADGLFATTDFVAPELTWPGEPADSIRRQSAERVRYVLKCMRAYCESYDGGRMEEAFKSFLLAYETEIAPLYGAEMARREREEQERLSREQDRRSKEQAQLAQERRQRELAAAVEKTRQEQDASAKANAAAIEKRRNEEVFAQKQAEAQTREREIRSGQRPISSLRDAAIFHQPTDGSQIVLSPPVRPATGTYALRGVLDRRRGDLYVFRIGEGASLAYFGVTVSDRTFTDPALDLRYNGCAYFIGRHTGTTEYETVIGSARPMALFQAVAIGPCM